jgi:hypothetical protein
VTHPVRQTKTDALVAHIKGLGSDKFFTPIGIRTKDLAEATGVPANSIQQLLDSRVKSGDIVACTITGASGYREREYRAGPGLPPPDFKPLNTRRNGIARGATTKPMPVTTPAPSLSTPKPAVAAIRTPTFLKPTQPEVVAPAQKTPAAEARPPMRAAPAVAAVPATPKPQAGAALKKEPATRKASAGDDLRVGINADGVMVIALDDDSIELDIHQVLRLGDFLHATQGVWRP